MEIKWRDLQYGHVVQGIVVLDRLIMTIFQQGEAAGPLVKTAVSK